MFRASRWAAFGLTFTDYCAACLKTVASLTPGLLLLLCKVGRVKYLPKGHDDY